ncbi:MAG: hypothetical protein FK733_06775 [Asgard group archaeon]|nr:hypothetical protein [Asgard group archaeon]
MDQGKSIAVVLVEFDTMKGPVIRKSVPKDHVFQRDSELDSILMWILRANEFSVRKIGKLTAYAKTISLDDPNFQRKKRQFGLAIITEKTIELDIVESIIDKIIKLAKKKANNKPYFRMLHELLEIIASTQKAISGIEEPQVKEQLQPKISTEVVKSQPTTPATGIDNFEQFLLMSKVLQSFNKVTIVDKKMENKIIVSSVDVFGKVDKIIGEISEIESKRYIFQVDIKGFIPKELAVGFHILSRILEAIPIENNVNERFVVAIEFLDRLLIEQVDLEYYLPFLQYFISMENYTITEFLNEEYEKQLSNLQETHGEWIKSLSGANLDGKRLPEFFKITGVRREGLELLVDLLFVKIIAIY